MMQEKSAQPQAEEVPSSKEVSGRRWGKDRIFSGLALALSAIGLTISLIASYRIPPKLEWFAGEAFATLLVGAAAIVAALVTIFEQRRHTQMAVDAGREAALLQGKVESVRSTGLELVRSSTAGFNALAHVSAAVINMAVGLEEAEASGGEFDTTRDHEYVVEASLKFTDASEHFMAMTFQASLLGGGFAELSAMSGALSSTFEILTHHYVALRQDPANRPTMSGLEDVLREGGKQRALLSSSAAALEDRCRAWIISAELPRGVAAADSGRQDKA